MKSRSITVALILLAGCSESPPEMPLTVSPLISAESDRLWMLARAARVGDGKECKELYLQPDDRRYQGRRQRCDFWSRDYADYLRLNGFPSIEHLHLQDPRYWQWFLDTRQRIAECKTAMGSMPIGVRDTKKRAAHRIRRNQCDPYDDARLNQNMTPAELGIRFN